MIKQLVIVLLGVLFRDVAGHGMMTNPPGRSSVWRHYSGYPANYDDNSVYCGGLTFMTNQGGKCGVCGDPYTTAHPQDNENTGKYGKGKIVGEYKAGQVIDVSSTLTTNHKGTFEYALCVLSNPSTYESGEDCFIPLKLEDGSDKYEIGTENQFFNRVKLPDGIACERCVLRWHYRAANNWGDCEDGTRAPGCGFQETFRSCADITIRA